MLFYLLLPFGTLDPIDSEDWLLERSSFSGAAVSDTRAEVDFQRSEITALCVIHQICMSSGYPDKMRVQERE